MRRPVRRWSRKGSKPSACSCPSTRRAPGGDGGRAADRGGRAEAAATCRPGCASTGTWSGNPGRCTVGREAGVVACSSQRHVHLGDPPSHQRREIQVGADGVARRGGRLRRGQLDQRRGAVGRRVLAVAGQHALEEPAQLLARVLPGGLLRWGRRPGAPPSCSARRGAAGIRSRRRWRASDPGRARSGSGRARAPGSHPPPAGGTS